ncbi:G-protein coupled receptors family 1 profile domain-containing protein [Caenorhabditis elegans]|uniref:G-protein coupled receptors family 1 profile domain-containing protein n=1 Tax=Caenorhabditis elegans TaxID=6239 RepID=A0A0K3AT59_CAEEL|nr:G-protein coupled receptors family 1 profile domain-containing protein [Caenorhabditis elegans]CTQ86999.1 G-protein coupled receptors family 1 profile domain-containing protein [Caenorhabditis elegans]|eukprot:NP_001300300.1 Serpentine Receptor, class W [Caenorhabditis elegans]
MLSMSCNRLLFIFRDPVLLILKISMSGDSHFIIINITSDSLVKAYADAMSWSVQYHFKRCSSWLGILMAGVRILIMRKISNAKFSKIMKPIFGISLMAIVFGISGILTTVWQYECQVIENRTYPLSPNCAEHQDIHGVFRFSLILRPVSTVADVVILRSYFISDSIISSLIPGISFPLLAVVLIREIRKLEKSRTRAIRTLSTAENEEKYGLSTKLIGLMTVAAFLSETPLGLISIFKQFFTKGDINIRLLTDLVIYFTILATFVSILHPVLCLLMSSKYCETLRKMFGISKTLPNSVTSIHII